MIRLVSQALLSLFLFDRASNVGEGFGIVRGSKTKPQDVFDIKLDIVSLLVVC